MKNERILQIRSNCNFSLDYDSGKLIPEAELIILTAAPKYILNKKNGIDKTHEVDEWRVTANLHTVNAIIGELQLLVQNLSKFDQTAGAFNAIIESAKEKDKKV